MHSVAQKRAEVGKKRGLGPYMGTYKLISITHDSTGMVTNTQITIAPSVDKGRIVIRIYIAIC